MTDGERVLHYRGDCTDFDPGLGPDMYGGRWSPTSAVYNPAIDRTTIWFLPYFREAHA